MSSQVAVLESVQRFLDRQHGLFIDGQWVSASSEQRLPVFNPASGRQISSTADASAGDVDQAVTSAWRAFTDRRWSGMLPAQRERVLLRFADLVEQYSEELAQLETLEQGKSINISRAFEVGCTLNWMRYTAGLTTKITGQTLDVSIPLPPGARYQAWTRKEPVGVVAGIVPWNFPLMIGIWKVMPALAAGCSIVIKPSETTPLTLLRVAELACEAGVPPGVFNVVTGSGAVCGAALTTHPQVAKVSFTGSTATGKQIARVAADRLTRVTLELGGKNPAIVLKDADPAMVVEGLMTGSFLNQGQVCAASSRIYIEAPVFDQMVDAFAQAVKSLSVGPGMDPQAMINPLVSSAHQQKVAAYLEDARVQKTEIITGNAAPEGDGFYIAPSLIINPAPTLKLVREEVFGPVVNLVRVASGEEALRLANDSDFGLTASVWTSGLSNAMTYSQRLQAGTVWVNSHTLIDANLPFGGVKQSGSGRDFGPDWLDAYCETKSVCVRY
ncbi:aldehyde dehydrogenase family protein [Shimwellia blattae]|uniref:Phenylacetaldehyde dehydrogenase n=1 Tax=Shimwellia blattae (strain ATCC 29907 / DSM 4481 / JCM 1650 / NBRC 105725 / CDC 9005-74) TaxID=630626 RepID=I2B954_SHIBC|nr:aldehyde dehydrogenase family protein [Shimwellia blattae]AFJ47058.1 phenylacetaldehyde dehydrogenase [Shimwellia blattae DSM 4481 = NBRC 105725]GAB80820.1 phenylacetaldehyde dehydrogenase [Shimwellia blattae DSM 4481 = NBRC 105725]VDY64551.1 Phenylacetaldehyde dehydrogenase [Shimwellia blattae]VEC22659.1 Phenylacetaldehyde dehydrogenase [Shimwellia blattae]